MEDEDDSKNMKIENQTELLNNIGYNNWERGKSKK